MNGINNHITIYFARIDCMHACALAQYLHPGIRRQADNLWNSTQPHNHTTDDDRERVYHQQCAELLRKTKHYRRLLHSARKKPKSLLDLFSCAAVYLNAISN